MKKPWVTILILILITLPTVLPFFNSKFFYTQDYIFIARINQMSTALSFGQFPVRWAPDLRYGEPIFNYYASLPYYLGAIIHLMGFNFIWVSKILFILSTFFSAVTMYIFANKLFGKKAALLGAILYTYAPYRAVDLYVRGSLSETWAFVFFPLIFYASYLIMEKVSLKGIGFLALSLTGLFLTHNVTTLMFLPYLFLWWVYLATTEALKEKQRKFLRFITYFLFFCGALFLSLGISASFLLPASLERDFIQTKYLLVGYFNFRAHFVAYKQFFSTFWGYGSSVWGPNDGLSFQVGLVNWLIIILTLILGIILRNNRKLLGLLGFLIISFALSIFLQHNKSAFVWEAVPLMAFVQFPWRFLGISIFIVSTAGAAITPFLKGKVKAIYFVLIAASFLSTIWYFRPKEYVDDSFFDKFLNKEKMHQGIDLTKDYLPIWVQNVDAPLLNYPQTDKGQIEVSSFEKKGAKATSQIKVLKDSVIEVPISYFPGWVITANNKSIKLENPSEKGLIRFNLPQGKYHIYFEFRDTPIRMIGNTISVVSLLIFTLLLSVRKVYRHD